MWFKNSLKVKFKKTLKAVNPNFWRGLKVLSVSLFTSNYECTPLYLQNFKTPLSLFYSLSSIYFSLSLSLPLLVNIRDLKSLSHSLSLSLSPIITLLFSDVKARIRAWEYLRWYHLNLSTQILHGNSRVSHCRIFLEM